MHQILLWITVLSLYSVTATAQLPTFEQLDDKLTPYFFEGKRDTAGWLLWQPNLGEKAGFPISHDGFCYTRLDTVLYIEVGEISYATALFRTTEQEMMCRVCSPVMSAATFRKKEGAWHLQDFEKALPYFGVWNERGEVRLLQVSETAFALGIKKPLSGMQGYAEGREQLYYQGINLLFSYLYEQHLPDRYQLRQTIDFQNTASSGPLYDIELQQTRTYLEGKKEQEKRQFHYDTAFEQYLEK